MKERGKEKGEKLKKKFKKADQFDCCGYNINIT